MQTVLPDQHTFLSLSDHNNFMNFVRASCAKTFKLHPRVVYATLTPKYKLILRTHGREEAGSDFP